MEYICILFKEAFRLLCLNFTIVAYFTKLYPVMLAKKTKPSSEYDIEISNSKADTPRKAHTARATCVLLFI